MLSGLLSLALIVRIFTTVTALDMVNGKSFSSPVAQHVMHLGKVEEWTVRNEDGFFAHPFHMHVNHMQLAEAPSNRFGFSIGDYYDVVAMPLTENNGEFKVRFRPADFTGDANVVVHCHLLFHEDGGMMLVTSIE